MRSLPVKRLATGNRTAFIFFALYGVGVALAANGSNDTVTLIRVCPRNGNFGEDTTICAPDTNITGGYEYKLFVDAWNTMGSSIKSKYMLQFKPCRSYKQVISDTKNGECDVSFGSITAAAVGDRNNLSFCGTSLNGALIVAVKKGKEQNRLAATAPFSQQSKNIITVICCLFVSAWVLDYLGRWVIKFFTMETHDQHFLLEALEEGKGLKFFGTSLMVLVAIITIQLLFSVFCSYLTSALLLDNPGGVSSVSDLKRTGKPIWTSRSYGQRAAALGFRNVKAEDPVQPQEWYDRLVEKETIGGILLDDIVLINFAQQYPEQVFLVKEPLAPYSLAFAWNREVPQELTVEFERVVRVLWDSGYVEQHVQGLLVGQGFATYTFGSNVGVTDNTDRKFNVMDVIEFKTAFIATLIAAGLVFIAEMLFQIVMKKNVKQHEELMKSLRSFQGAPAASGTGASLHGAATNGQDDGMHK